MAESTTLTIRVDTEIKQRLESLAQVTKRSKSALAAEGLAAFVEREERQIEGIRKAMASLDRGLGVESEDVAAWVASWDGDGELPPPKSTGE